MKYNNFISENIEQISDNFVVEELVDQTGDNLFTEELLDPSLVNASPLKNEVAAGGSDTTIVGSKETQRQETDYTNLAKNEGSGFLTDASVQDFRKNDITVISENRAEAIEPEKKQFTLSFEIVLMVFTLISFVTSFGLLMWGVYKYVKQWRVCKNTRLVQKVGGISVVEGSEIQAPMSFGLIRAKIYLPEMFCTSSKDYRFIISHERAHIQRHDTLKRVLAYVTLCFYWWNPLAWCMFVLFNKDIEMACDETVLKSQKEDVRGEYATTLLNYAKKSSGLQVFMAFSESNTESRIKNIINYRKRSFLIVVVSLVAVLVIAVFVMVKPSGEPVDEPVAEAVLESIPDRSELVKYESISQMVNDDYKYWKAKLNGKEVYIYSVIYPSDEEVSDEVKYSVFFTMDEDMIPTYHMTKNIFSQIDGEYYTSKEDIECLDYSAENILKDNECSDLFYLNYAMENPANLENILNAYEKIAGNHDLTIEELRKIYEEEGVSEDFIKQIGLNYADYLKNKEECARKYLDNPSGIGEKLKDPLTAIETWFHIEEKGRVYLKDNHAYCDEWVYVDAKGDYYTVYTTKILGMYFPSTICHCERTQLYSKIEPCLNGLTVQKLLDETIVPIDGDLGYGNAEEEEIPEKYYVVHEFEEDDATLYCLYGGYGTILRVKDKVYTLLTERYPFAESYNTGSFYRGDFDKDGEAEYIIMDNMASQMRLLDVIDGQLCIVSPLRAMILYGLIDANIDNGNRKVNFNLEGEISTSFFVPDSINVSDKTQIISLGDYNDYYVIKNNELYCDLEYGIKFGEDKNSYKLGQSYDVTVKMLTRLYYSSDGEFKRDKFVLQNISGIDKETPKYLEYSDCGISFEYPADWRCALNSSEDGSKISVYDENGFEQVEIKIYEAWRTKAEIDYYKTLTNKVFDNQSVAGLDATSVLYGGKTYLFDNGVTGYEIHYSSYTGKVEEVETLVKSMKVL